MADNKAAKTAETKTRKQRASKKLNYDQVLQGAFSLSLEDRARLAKDLAKSVREEITSMEQRVNTAAELLIDK